MKYKQKLIEAVFLKRYKRFFADIELKGKTEVAHVANTGSLKSVNNPGQACLVSPAENPERKLRFTLEAIMAPGGSSWIGVNTSLPNHLVKEAFENSVIPHWTKFDEFKSEIKVNAETRLDAVLSKGDKKHYVEVKNVTMAEEIAGKKVALFPDGVTERGQKHLRELMSLVKEGHTAEIFFTVQRQDCQEFRPADHIDPEYGKLLRQAAKAGVLISVYVVRITTTEIVLLPETLKLVM